MTKIAKNVAYRWIRRGLMFLLDILLVFVALKLATALRYDGSMGAEFQKMNAKIVPITPLLVGIYMVALVLGGTYVSMWRYAGAKELARLVIVCAVTAVIETILNYLFKWHISRAILMMTGMCAAALVGGSRFAWKLYRENIVNRRQKNTGARLLIVGAGDSGKYALQLCKSGAVAGTPVCFVDNDMTKKGEKLQGLPVMGEVKDIPDIARRKDITDILIALPNAEGDAISEIVEVCHGTRCNMKILSSPNDLSDKQKQTFRELNTSDFLSRGEVKLDIDGIKGYISNQVVMVTGGGGSIGSEICRQIMRFSPSLLIIFDIYENCAYELERELIQKYGVDCPIKALIGSIRDKNRLDEVFDEYRPSIVFHAAAHKHVPLLEFSPAEAIKNNVFGTYNLLKSASEHGVKRLVQLSTDKAVNPTNVMGASKRVTEMLIQLFSRTTNMKCMAVRFGNVLGSHGSIIPLWESQIKAGGPVTLTHRDITRYFMTIPEAAQLVLQAGAIADSGAIYVLDMGQPVKMIDLAKKIIRFYGYTPDVDMPISIIGLRPGEKLYEELMMESEQKAMSKTAHNKIFVAPPIPMDDMRFLGQLNELKNSTRNDDTAVIALTKIVPTFSPERFSEKKAV